MAVGKEEVLPGSPGGSQEWWEHTEPNPWHLPEQIQSSPLPLSPRSQPGESHKAAEPTQGLLLPLWLGASQVAISDTQGEGWACNLQPLSTSKQGAAGTWGRFLNTQEALGGGPDGGQSLGQSGQCPLWGQEYQDSSDQGGPRWKAGDSLPPVGLWQLSQQEEQDPVQGREASWWERDASASLSILFVDMKLAAA